MNFGEVLKNVRIKNNDSYRSLADKIDLHFTYVDKVEKGKATVSKNMIEKLISVYPLQKEELIQSYLMETIPEDFQTLVGLSKDENIVNNFMDFVNILDSDNQLMVFNYILERLQIMAIMQGKQKEVEPMVKHAKEIINNIKKEG